MPRSRSRQHAAAAEWPFAAVRGPCGSRIAGKQRRTKQLTPTVRLGALHQNPTHTRRHDDGAAHDRRTKQSPRLRPTTRGYPCTRLDITRRAYPRHDISTTKSCRLALKPDDSLARHRCDSALALAHRLALLRPEAPDTDTRPEEKSQYKQPRAISRVRQRQGFRGEPLQAECCPNRHIAGDKKCD